MVNCLDVYFEGDMDDDENTKYTNVSVSAKFNSHKPFIFVLKK